MDDAQRFEEVKCWVRETYAWVGDGDSYTLFDLERVRMRAVLMTPEGWLAVAGVICGDDLIQPVEALIYNRYRARVGALAIERRQYQLRQLLPLALLDRSTFADVASALAKEVLKLGRLACPAFGPCDEVFAAYRD